MLESSSVGQFSSGGHARREPKQPTNSHDKSPKVGRSGKLAPVDDAEVPLEKVRVQLSMPSVAAIHFICMCQKRGYH